jgi:hypothetical protein
MMVHAVSVCLTGSSYVGSRTLELNSGKSASQTAQKWLDALTNRQRQHHH